MSELSFAKTFLSTLDSRPQKLSPDHVEDPKSYPARPPYILPRMPKQMSRRTTSAAPGSERSLTVAVKSLRNPPLDIRLSSQALNTSILDVKTAVAAQAGIPVDKMKILFKKKPVVDSKVLKDLVEEGETAVEFSVMVMGGAAAAVTKADGRGKVSEVAQGPSGKEVVESEAFWNDLRGYLLQRIRDEKQVDELFSLFLRAWEGRP